MIALSYGAIFREPVAELFAGLHQTIELTVEERVAELEKALQQQSGKGMGAPLTARKLEWLAERRSAVS